MKLELELELDLELKLANSSFVTPKCDATHSLAHTQSVQAASSRQTGQAKIQFRSVRCRLGIEIRASPEAGRTTSAFSAQLTATLLCPERTSTTSRGWMKLWRVRANVPPAGVIL